MWLQRCILVRGNISIIGHQITTGSLWFYSKDEATNFNTVIADNNNFKYFKFKTKLLGNTEAQPAPDEANGVLKNATIAVPLMYLSNFWRLLEMLLILCKVELKLNGLRKRQKLSKFCSKGFERSVC